MSAQVESAPILTATTPPENQEEAELNKRLRRQLSSLAQPDARKALIQLLGTALPFIGGFALMIWSVDVSYWLTLALAIPMVGLYIRLFIFQHDCGHGSFLPWRTANHWLGSMIGILTLTPYFYWRRTHAAHHAGHGDLERRGMGDIATLTVSEYKSRNWWGRLRYRLYRHPLVFLGVGPFYTFALKHRLPLDIPLSWKKEWISVWYTNVALALVATLAYFTIGVDKLLLAFGPIFFLGSALGVWLFYVQHQFEHTYWSPHEHWSFDRAGIDGSSFFDLPPILHWYTGNIGYHHIHHLASRIPNYQLPKVQRSIPELSRATRLSLAESFRCARLKLWDEAEGRLVPFKHLRQSAA